VVEVVYFFLPLELIPFLARGGRLCVITESLISSFAMGAKKITQPLPPSGLYALIE